jgi:hypothetical protein
MLFLELFVACKSITKAIEKGGGGGGPENKENFGY